MVYMVRYSYPLVIIAIVDIRYELVRTSLLRFPLNLRQQDASLIGAICAQ